MKTKKIRAKRKKQKWKAMKVSFSFTLPHKKKIRQWKHGDSTITMTLAEPLSEVEQVKALKKHFKKKGRL